MPIKIRSYVCPDFILRNHSHWLSASHKNRLYRFRLIMSLTHSGSIPSSSRTPSLCTDGEPTGTPRLPDTGHHRGPYQSRRTPKKDQHLEEHGGQHPLPHLCPSCYHHFEPGVQVTAPPGSTFTQTTVDGQGPPPLPSRPVSLGHPDVRRLRDEQPGHPRNPQDLPSHPEANTDGLTPQRRCGEF